MRNLPFNFLVAVVIVAMLNLPPTIAHGVLAQDALGTAEVGGAEFAVGPGDVVTQGTPTTEGDSKACVLPEVTLSATGDATVSEIVITTEVTDDCQLVVTGIDKVASGQSDAVMATTRYRGGAWAEHKDCCGFVLTRAYTDMYYYDSGSSVWGGHNLLGFCETPTRDGWYVDWCSYNWSPGGSSSVSSWTIGEFGFWEGSYYHGLDATFYGWPGGDWRPYCNYWGSFVPGRKLNCGGKHWVA
jgi:hypothetical protein